MTFEVCMSRDWLFFLSPPTSHELQYISVTSGFTRLNMKTKYVRRGLISLYVIFHNNRTMWSTNLLVKICRWGGGGEEKERVILHTLKLSDLHFSFLKKDFIKQILK